MSQSPVALHIKRLLEHSGSSINGIWLSSKAGIPRVTLRRSFKDPVNGASKKTVQGRGSGCEERIGSARSHAYP